MKKKIQIIAPASYANLTEAQKKYIISFLQKNDFSPSWAPHTFTQEFLFRASDKHRLSDLMNAFKKNIPIVMTIRGGSGSANLLPLIDWNILKESSSLFVGFSDLTTFQNAYYTMTGKPSLTGMVAQYICPKQDPSLWTSFVKTLEGQGFDFKGLPNLAPGKASGVLIGGNLTCFQSLIGTPYLPKLKGKILLLEEVAEAPYRVDRMLAHLKNAGIFDKVNGVILGDFYQCRNDDDKTDGPVYNVLKNFFKGFKIPVVYGLPYGHTSQHFCLPFGTVASMDTQKRMLHIDGLQKK